jgi:tRNA1Val (adenine37-N6)-methyltransferase
MKVCTDSCLFGAWLAAKAGDNTITPETILDIGTGTGLLSMMLAQKSNAQIHAVDIDKNSLVQASENFSASPWDTRLQAFHSDIREWNTPFKYDLIVANPPFYQDDLLPPGRGKSISKHSTAVRLEDLLIKAKGLLHEEGKFALLLPAHTTEWFENVASGYSLFATEKTQVRQTPSHNYFRTMMLLENKKTAVSITGMSIKNNDDRYTLEFIELLKDYYLYL